MGFSYMVHLEWSWSSFFRALSCMRLFIFSSQEIIIQPLALFANKNAKLVFNSLSYTLWCFNQAPKAHHPRQSCWNTSILISLQINLEINALLGGRYPLESWLLSSPQLFSNLASRSCIWFYVIVAGKRETGKKRKRVNLTSIIVILWLFNSFLNWFHWSWRDRYIYTITWFQDNNVRKSIFILISRERLITGLYRATPP